MGVSLKKFNFYTYMSFKQSRRGIYLKMEKYDDIINLQHHVSKVHPHLSIEQRAAQFAPFAALTGYEDEVNDAAEYFTENFEKNNEHIEMFNDF